MTKRLLAFFVAVILALPAALAENPRPTAASAQGDNFVLSLSSANQEGEGVSVVVTSSQAFSLSRGSLTFNGTLNKTDDGGYRLDYLLETGASHGGTIHTGSSVILRPGEPVQLVKNGEQFYNLRLDHYPPAEAAKKEPSPAAAH